MNLERRYLDTEFEVRAHAGPSGGHTVTGYAAKWEKSSQNLGGFVEQIRAGAFTRTIREADVRALFNHDPNIVLGRNKAGTLRLAEDTSGLHYEVDMPNTTVARDLVESMQRGDISQSSFGFATITEDWGFTERDFPLRTLIEAKLYDVSPVTFPAYLDTESTARAAFKSLASARSMSLDDIAGIAASGGLGDLLSGVTAPVEEAPPAGAPDWARALLAIAERS